MLCCRDAQIYSVTQITESDLVSYFSYFDQKFCFVRCFSWQKLKQNSFPESYRLNKLDFWSNVMEKFFQKPPGSVQVLPWITLTRGKQNAL